MASDKAAAPSSFGVCCCVVRVSRRTFFHVEVFRKIMESCSPENATSFVRFSQMEA